MSLLVVGMSHRTAPVSLLERAAVGADELPSVLQELLRTDHISEVLVLSTCNRVEVYAEVDRFHGGLEDTSSVLAHRVGLDFPALGEHLYVHYEDAAIQHLFSVAAGLDSMVMGESQILGQLRTAYGTASALDAVNRELHEVFQHALRAGKRVHAETGIDRAGASVVSVGLHEAARVLGPLDGLRALVVGAGSMGALSAATLVRAGIGELVVANRSPERALRLAASLAGDGTGPVVRPATMDDVPAELAAADLVIGCTGSVGAVLTAGTVEATLPARSGRPLVLLDLALPRDFDRAAGALDGVHYLDLEALAEPSVRLGAHDDVDRARAIVDQEVAGRLGARRATAVTPTVTALRARAAEVVDAELSRLDARLPGLDGTTRAEVARSVHRVVQSLLHAPTVRVKELAERPGGGAYADALRELFDLDPAATAAVAAVNPPGEALPAELSRAGDVSRATDVGRATDLGRPAELADMARPAELPRPAEGDAA
ncbi:MAG TPA: glutamyl-tRNA reductase [Mycobacteriales bacterium]|nr:glutamyl-tRNA reductase [Mycobacteriales bacterium]